MPVVTRAARAILLAGLLVALLATPAAAFELNGGCNLTLTSTDASGGALDTASGPGAAGGGTQADPFLIDWDGSVSWLGTSGATVFLDHTWQVYVFLIPTPVRGGDPNDGGDTTGEGSAGVGQNAPFRFTGLYYVSGQIDGAEGAHCDGSGWFKLTGDPIGTVGFWAAVGVALVGLAVVWSARPSAAPSGGS